MKHAANAINTIVSRHVSVRLISVAVILPVITGGKANEAR